MPRKNTTAPVHITAAERRGKALELRRAGNSYAFIGAQLGISRQRACEAVHEALATLAQEQTADADALRGQEDDRLDLALRSIYTQVRAGHLGAVAAWVRISESRRKLWGLDAPTNVNVLITQEAERLAAETGMPLPQAKAEIVAVLQGTGKYADR